MGSTLPPSRGVESGLLFDARRRRGLLGFLQEAFLGEAVFEAVAGVKEIVDQTEQAA